MADYFEIDFLGVETKKSGDAIPLRYSIAGNTYIHVVDGGYQDTGQKVVGHIRKYYGNPSLVDHVVLTHPDGDHAGGLRVVLEEFDVRTLWMLRPWVYSAELLPRFPRFESAKSLAERLREAYPNAVALEDIANRKGITIREPFQGAAIGAFTVLTPTKDRYLNLVVESEKTPEGKVHQPKSAVEAVLGYVTEAASKAVVLMRAAWGEETFSSEEAGCENEMSIVQYALLCGQRILLTGDAGRAGLTEAAAFAPTAGLTLPGVDRFQVPHHGSRRNISTEILDRWLGTRLSAQPSDSETKFLALISSAKEDVDHPRKSVIRALIHRGGRVLATEGKDMCTGQNAPARENWTTAVPIEYPNEQESS